MLAQRIQGFGNVNPPPLEEHPQRGGHKMDSRVSESWGCTLFGGLEIMKRGVCVCVYVYMYMSCNRICFLGGIIVMGRPDLGHSHSVTAGSC